MIKYFQLLLILIFTLSGSYAQQGGEALVELETTPVSQFVSKRYSVATINLPFFDDFSQGNAYPLTELWRGEHVFINVSYAINPKSIGVATFDAISSSGDLHPNASVYQFSADTLLSNSINLGFPGDTTIYLSFWYQPQGFGNQPQPKDSLILEFFDSEQNNWISAWAVSADFSSNTIEETNHLLPQLSKSFSSQNPDAEFFMVHFPIRDSRFLYSDFRFRFRNYASISENYQVPSIRGNSDHWHLDMVWLDKDRTYRDTILNDVTYFKPMGSILANYQSLPWKHFAEAQDQELSGQLSFTVHYRNLGPETWNVTRRFAIENLSNGSVYSFSSGAENISAFSDVPLTRYFIYDFNSDWADSAKFCYTSYLITDINPETYLFRWNDTVRYTQTYSNYYAYDDGTAENGYGLFGEGTQNGRVAMKFTNYKADSLVGVYMYFNRTVNDENQKYFKLGIWSDNNGKPGDLIYEQLGLRPNFTDKLNKFELFELDEPLWLEPGVFYIGWIQITTDFLNIGFDLNHDNSSRIFYNISGQWNSTQYDGTIMLRPAFGELYQIPTSNPLVEKQNDLTLFPNPANYSFSIDLDHYESIDLKIFTITGQQVMSVRYTGSAVDVGQFPAGTYIVKIFRENIVLGSKKLVIVR